MILAIYSKSRFDAEARGLGEGDVFAIDRYTSRNKALTKLSQGGTLFVVTVRPGDVLWLVAVLEDPRDDGTAWVAEKNQVPICDITELIGQLELAGGKGIHAAPGKLGMSLQTPRQLSDRDVELLRAIAAAAQGSPEATERASEPTRASKKSRSKRAGKAETDAGDPAKSERLDSGVRLETIVEHLGSGWRVEGEQLVHAASGVAFAFIPGGWLRMGFSADDLFYACLGRKRPPYGPNSDWPGQVVGSRPAHIVAVAPFLIAIARHPMGTPALAEGFRHPSEAELEWVFRRGMQDRWVCVPADEPFLPKTRDHLVANPRPPFGLSLG